MERRTSDYAAIIIEQTFDSFSTTNVPSVAAVSTVIGEKFNGCVHTTGNEVIAGNKKFSDAIQFFDEDDNAIINLHTGGGFVIDFNDPDYGDSAGAFVITPQMAYLTQPGAGFQLTSANSSSTILLTVNENGDLLVNGKSISGSPQKLYTITGQNTDGSPTQKLFTDVIINKADLTNGKISQAQMPVAGFNTIGGIKPHPSYFASNGTGNSNFVWTLPTAQLNNLIGGSCFVYNAEIYRYNSMATSVASFAELLANSTRLVYTGTFVNNDTKNAVKAGTFTNGELQGTQPANSYQNMKFCDATYRYEFMNGMNDTDGTTFVWVRLHKG